MISAWLLVLISITYISILQEVGTIDHLAEMAITIGAPIIVAIVLCYVIGITSAFASSTALRCQPSPPARPQSPLTPTRWLPAALRKRRRLPGTHLQFH